MTDAPQSRFVYVTYIRTTPERLFAALTDPELSPQWWLGNRHEGDWRVGGAWRLLFPDGTVGDDGEITEYDPPRRLVIRWHNRWKPEVAAEGWSTCSFTLEPQDGAVKLTLDHSMARPNSQLIAAVSGGWPQLLSNLKSLIETGTAIFPPRYEDTK